GDAEATRGSSREKGHIAAVLRHCCAECTELASSGGGCPDKPRLLLHQVAHQRTRRSPQRFRCTPGWTLDSATRYDPGFGSDFHRFHCGRERSAACAKISRRSKRESENIPGGWLDHPSYG